MLTRDSASMGRIENSESFIGGSVTTGEVQCGSRDGPVPAGDRSQLRRLTPVGGEG